MLMPGGKSRPPSQGVWHSRERGARISIYRARHELGRIPQSTWQWPSQQDCFLTQIGEVSNLPDYIECRTSLTVELGRSVTSCFPDTHDSDESAWTKIGPD